MMTVQITKLTKTMRTKSLSKDKEVLPVKLSYKLDSFLMYLIQDVTKRPSIEIINFFHELSTQVAELGQKKRTGRGIHKKIDDYFPGTSIPFFMELEGSCRYSNQYDPVTRTYQTLEPKTFNCDVHVGFPDRPTYIDAKVFEEIGDFLMEKALLGVDVPADSPANAPFVRPAQRSSKMYKELMDNFAGRPVEEKPKRKRKSDG